MKYILLIITVLFSLLLAFILLVIISAYIVPNNFSDKNSRYFRFLFTGSLLLTWRIMRIKIKVTGMEKLPKDTRFLMVGNHISNFDPMVVSYVFRKYDIAFISKPENFHIFAFGRIIKKCCFMPINRENPALASKTLKRAEGLIKNNEVSIGVYPEGTRGDGSELLPFHNGLFHIAKSTNVPVVVVGITGSRNIAHNFPLHGSTVNIEVMDIIDAEYVKEHRTSVIGERVFEKLNTLYPIK